MKNKSILAVLMAAFMSSFLFACSAYTPGPSTSRSMAVPIAVTTAAETQTVVTTPAPATTKALVEEETTEESSEEETEDLSNIVYATKGVNVRDSSARGSNVIGTLRAGTPVKKLGEDGNWTIVEYEGQKAYVFSEYLSPNKPDEE